ncbi:MAG: phage holin family protein [bacterium]
MTALLRIAALLATGAAQRAARRAAEVSVLVILALTFLMIGLVGLCAALFILLSRYMDPALLALLLGSFFCLVAAVLLLMAKSRSQMIRPMLPTPEIDFELARREAKAFLDRASPATIWTPVIIAAVIGYLVTTRRR